MQPDIQQTLSRVTLRKALLVLVGVLALLAFYLIATSGRVVVNNLPNDAVVTLQPGLQFDEKPKTIKPSSYQKSGTYLLGVIAGSDIYNYKITVPRFLGKATVTVQKTPRLKAQKIANNVLDLNVTINKVVYSMEKLSTDGAVLVHTPSDSVPFTQTTTSTTSSYFVPFAVVSNQFLGYTQKVPNSDELILATFDPSANKVTALLGTSDLDSNPDDIPQVLTNQSSGFLIISTAKQFYYYKNSSEKPRILKIDAQSYSESGGTPIVDLVGETLFLYKGASFDASELNNENTNKAASNKKPGSFTITPYSLTTNSTSTAITGDLDAAVASLRVSPDKSKFAMNTDNKRVAVYDTSGSIVTTLPINSDGNQLEWLDTTHLMYLDAKEGLLGVDVTNSSTRTLFSSSVLTYSSYSRTGQNLLLLGYVKTADKSQISGNFSLGKVLYLIDLEKTMTDNSVVDKTPYIDVDYAIDTVGGKLYFVPLAIGPDDILFTNQTVLRTALNNRINTAKDYLKTNGVSTRDLVISRDLVLPNPDTSF